jgi:hypothetical protein
MPTTDTEANRHLKLVVLPGSYAICRIDASAGVPMLPLSSDGFWSLTQTTDEISLVCLEEHVSDDARAEPGWFVLRVEGPFAFSETGILSSVLRPLSEAAIGIFAVSTFDTDYVLVKREDMGRASQVLRDAGHQVEL